MKVLCIICNDKWMTNSFVAGWKSLGFDVDVFYYNPNLVRVDYSPAGWKMVAEMNRSLVEYVFESERIKNIDLIFCSILDDFISADTLLNLRKLKVPIVNYHCDMGVLWYRSIKTAKYFDLFCCAHKYGMDALRKMGAKVQYLPMAANLPDKHLNTNTQHKESFFSGVTFMGAPIGYRPSVLSEIYFSGIPLRIYGHNWDWCKREYVGKDIKKQSMLPLNDKVMHDVLYYAPSLLRFTPCEFLYEQFFKAASRLRNLNFDVEKFYGNLPPSIIHGLYDKAQFDILVYNSAINLGFSHVIGAEGSNFERRQVRLRDFEVPIAGGFYMAQYCDELAELYIEGVNIEFWRNRMELIDKIRYYLENDGARKLIAEGGRLNVITNHTWAHRFKTICSLLCK